MINKAKKKRIGKFKRRGTFEKEVKTPDGIGGSTVTFAENFKAWVNVKPINGTQKLHLDALDNEVSVLVEMRYRDLDFSTRNRLKVGDRIYQLHSIINEDEENAYMEVGASYVD
jgi:SPP1 family predicted phage head-tail adaptor